MGTTAQDVFNRAMALIDEIDSDGSLSDSADEYEGRAIYLLDLAQKELARIGDYFKTKEITHRPVDNQLGEQFDIVEHEDTDLTYEATGSQAYYFEVDGEATVYIEQYVGGAWSVLSTIAVPNTVTYFTAYSGNITPSALTNKVRIRFSGTYYYQTVNRALFEFKFQASRVPVYRGWVEYEMPSDFKSVDQIVEEYSQGNYAKDAGYKWEGKNSLYVKYDFEGHIRITYKPVPATVSTLSATLEIDDITAIDLVYQLAGQLMDTENPELAKELKVKYTELKAEGRVKQPNSWQPITDLYGGIES